MVSLIKRTRVLKTLLHVRIGPGAAILSSNVKRIHLIFARDLKGGHFGPRKFWRHYLPRLKFHNPSVPMTVDRHNDPEGPCNMTISFADSALSSGPLTPIQSTSGNIPTSSHVPTNETSSIDMKNKHEDTILEELLVATKALTVEPTPEEHEDLKRIEDQETASEHDRQRQEKFVAQQRRQKALLQQAKSSLEKD